MRNLLTLKDLSVDQIENIVDSALNYKKGKGVSYPHKQVANLFFEPSTRTNYSFIVAENKLATRVVQFSGGANTSIAKGETLKDTIRCFDSYDLDALVIRASENNYWESVQKHINTPIINAGDGTGNHPTQSLLDLTTIKENFGKFQGLKVAIVGDVAHSRVAHTNIEVMKRLGMIVYLVAPEMFQEKGYHWEDLDSILPEMDVVMLLRIQFERHDSDVSVSKEDYNAQYGLNESREKKMKNKAIILHPAPFNRGIELDDYIADKSKKNKIFEQMGNGVWARMAILDWVFKGNE